MDYDVIVVGAGPGGSAAAFELARSGARVALIEQQRLPRYKPCGGCLSLKIDRFLEPDFHTLVEKTVYGACFTFEGVEDFRAATDRPIAYMVMRDRFDLFLAEKARAAGADLRAGERALEAVEEEDRVRTKHGELSARYLIGADGAGGIVGRSPWTSRKECCTPPGRRSRTRASRGRSTISRACPMPTNRSMSW